MLKDELLESYTYWTLAAENAEDTFEKETCEKHAKIYEERLDDRARDNNARFQMRISAWRAARNNHSVIERILVTPWAILFRLNYWLFLIISFLIGSVFLYALGCAILGVEPG